MRADLVYRCQSARPGDNATPMMSQTRHVFVKHRCPRWQQCRNMAKSLSPIF